jgi:hypothetical protein
LVSPVHNIENYCNCLYHKTVKKMLPLKVFDIPVVALGVLLILAIAAKVYNREAASSRVVIRGNEKTWVFPLDAEESVLVTGVLGETRVEIHNGRAAIVSSPCAGQTCVASGDLHKNGQWAACLPNGVLVLVEGTHEEVIDAAVW